MGLIAHLLAGRSLDVGVTATMTVACVAGALAGATVAARVPQRVLGRGFAGLLTAVAGYLLVSAAVLGAPPQARQDGLPVVPVLLCGRCGEGVASRSARLWARSARPADRLVPHSGT